MITRLRDSFGRLAVRTGGKTVKRITSRPVAEAESLEPRRLLSGQTVPIATEVLVLEDSPTELHSLLEIREETILAAGARSFQDSVPKKSSGTTFEEARSFDTLFDDFDEEMMIEQEDEYSFAGATGVEILDDGTTIVPYRTDLHALTSGAPDEVAINLNIIKRVFHVRDFGAAGDGVTDDTKALQAALDAAAGQQLYLDAGTYLISGSLLISSDTTVVGEGAESVLQFTWRDTSEGEMFYLGNKNRSNESDGDYNIVLRDFKLVGGDSGDPYGMAHTQVTHGIWFRKVTNVTVTGLEITKTSGFAINNTGLINGNFQYNIIENTGRDGITSFPLIQEDDPTFKGYPLENLWVTDNYMANIGDDGVAVHAGTVVGVNFHHPPRNIHILNNTIISRVTDHSLSLGRGIKLTGVHEALIEGNDIRNTVSSGISITPWYNIAIDPHSTTIAIRSQDIVVRNNSIDGAGTAEGIPAVKIALQVKGSDRIEILNNTIRNSADRGIDVRDSTGIDVIGNSVSGSRGIAAVLLVGTEDGVVRDVVVRDNNIAHWSLNGLRLNNVINSISENNRVTLEV